ncbi:MAG: 2,3-bisphosphoglycerate-independent phosphoglycerate mutase [Phycisphaerae bacterium]|jgi:2,3-bisphosphoglycerate-independent phosphoglycerate mutase|nr:MAG: 2,3-bisphosphoglycerate-independent phosphoglycerate mutase [Phycisphaerae bacterium]
MPKPVVLIIRDGWGHNPYPEWNHANAVHLAKTPVADRIAREYPRTLIHTSGFDVGLPEGTMGNSEVGHQNIGAGRIVDQESVRITKEIRNGQFFSNSQLNAAIDHCINRNSNLHLFGIVSDAGVHGLLEHLYACLELCQRRQFNRVYLHAFTDGRDSPPNYGIRYLQETEQKMTELGVGKIATVSGRFWAMDRDKRWERVEKAYRAIAFGDGPVFRSAREAVQYYYEHPSEPTTQGDEFVTPSVISDDGHTPRATIRNGDSVIFYNYRGDRPRELTAAFVLPDFKGFDRGKPFDLYFVTMTAYEEGSPVHVAYPKPPKMTDILGEYVSKLGLKQFRCAETEKFPHVTFFFNDYREEPFPGEDRAIVPSPKLLPDGSPLMTYDQKPEMSAPGVCEETLKAIHSGQYDLIVVNFANGDMVGHTGSLPAAIKACETVDTMVGRIIQATQAQGGSLIVTADHGNAEQMIDPATGGPHTAHTIYDVELIIVDDRYKGAKLKEDGRLADVAPTVLTLMGLKQPPAMTGQSLL